MADAQDYGGLKMFDVTSTSKSKYGVYKYEKTIRNSWVSTRWMKNALGAMLIKSSTTIWTEIDTNMSGNSGNIKISDSRRDFGIYINPGLISGSMG